MMMTASKTCACGVLFSFAAPAVASDTLCGWIDEDAGFRYVE